MNTAYYQNARTKQVIRVSSRRDPRLNDGEIWFQITEAEYNAIRAVNSHEAAQRLAEQLAEAQGILEDLYNDRPVFGRLLDCIDSNAAALAEFQKVTK